MWRKDCHNIRVRLRHFATLAAFCFPLAIAQNTSLYPAKPPDEKPSDPAPVPSKTRLRLAGISVGTGYSHYSGSVYPYSYPFWSWYGPYSPFFPVYYVGFYNGFARQPNMGEIKLQSDDKNAEVFLNGAFAGTAGSLKSMWLEPGIYNLEVRPAHGSPYTRRIYILSGKTMKVKP